MKKKKLKKKYQRLQEQYQRLQEQYNSLLCEYIRLKTDDERIKAMTNDQILHTKEVLTNFAENVLKAIRNVYK